MTNMIHNKKTLHALLVTMLILVTSCAINKHEVKQDEPVTDMQLCGGYTTFRTLQQSEAKLFSETYTDEPALEPYEVATQVVAGINYKFRCKVKGGKDIYLVTIYKPLPGQGTAKVTSAVKERQ